MSSDKGAGAGCGSLLVLFVILVWFQMMKDGCSNNSTTSEPSSTNTVNRDANWNYVNERMKREGLSNKEASEAADAVIQFHNSRKK